MALRLQTPFGVCYGVTIPSVVSLDDAAFADLAPEEVAYARSCPSPRAGSFVAGRLALRKALSAAGLPAPGPILPRADGSPDVPVGIWASVSHKRDLAVAIASRALDEGGLGIDLESLQAGNIDIARRVLRPDELASLQHLPDVQRQRQVRLAFSVKEAIYKAAYPLVRRFFGFQDARVQLPLMLQNGRFVPLVAEMLLVDSPLNPHLDGAAFALEDHVITVVRAG